MIQSSVCVVPAVSWAVKLYKGLARARVEDGSFRQVMLMGLDDDTLWGIVQTDVPELARHVETILANAAIDD